MWRCVECDAEVDDNFDLCWNCGTSSDGILDPDFRSVADDNSQTSDETSEETEVEQSSNSCLRCDIPLHYRGVTRLDIFRDNDTLTGDLIEAVTGLSVNQKRLYVYVCRQCGHVELFAKRE